MEIKKEEERSRGRGGSRTPGRTDPSQEKDVKEGAYQEVLGSMELLNNFWRRDPPPPSRRWEAELSSTTR